MAGLQRMPVSTMAMDTVLNKMRYSVKQNKGRTLALWALACHPDTWGDGCTGTMTTPATPTCKGATSCVAQLSAGDVQGRADAM